MAAKFPQFDANYDHIDAFNHRILHVAITSNGIIDLRVQLYDYGDGFFQFLEEHPIFHAHTTIAYTKAPLTEAELSQLKQTLGWRLALPRHRAVNSFQLYGRSNQNEDYRTLASLSLAS